ncbi:MAG: formate/nitrite transporter family protein [Lachnospiraceae bacterium]|nr:formate/nitrite transporter family protein [Lachnospiraceae bacterium]
MNFFSPADVAQNYIEIGKSKANTPTVKLVILAILAGIFVALGAIASTTVAVAVKPASLGKFLGAVVFPGGLTMVLIAGSELFTGNCLLIIPLLEKAITAKKVVKSLVLTYIGNFIGSILLAAGVVFSHQISLFDNGVAVSVISTATTKCSISFGDALIKGILCNFLVCIAVWISFTAKDIVGKIIGVFFPVLIFVLCGFEHSVANMYYLFAGLFAKAIPAYAAAATAAGVDTSMLTVGRMFGANLLPVTIGNIIGGAICVGLPYWFIYLRRKKKMDILSED